MVTNFDSVGTTETTSAKVTTEGVQNEKGICFMALSPSQKNAMATEILNYHYVIKKNEITQRADFREKTEEEKALYEAFAESQKEGATKLLPARMGQGMIDESLELRPIRNYDFNSMKIKIDGADIPYSKESLNTLIDSNNFPSYNPLKEYLNGLPTYDGTKDYIAELAACVKMEGTDDPRYFLEMLRKWLVSSVASVMEENNSTQFVLILCGPQGIGKSTFFAHIIPSRLRKNYFTAKEINMSDKDDLLLLSTQWFLCLDELGNLSKKDIKKFKEFLTKVDITLRQPYARFNENYDRNCSLCGTSNDINILVDTTGNRRFAPFQITDIDLNALNEVDIDKVFAQAMSLYRYGYQYWIEKGPEQEKLERHNMKFKNLPPNVMMLLEVFEPCEGNEPGAKCKKVSEIANDIYVKTGHLIPQTKMGEFGKELDEAGFKIAKRTHGYTYRWVKERPQADAE